jgi:hypothetical protein
MAKSTTRIIFFYSVFFLLVGVAFYFFYPRRVLTLDPPQFAYDEWVETNVIRENSISSQVSITDVHMTDPPLIEIDQNSAMLKFRIRTPGSSGGKNRSSSARFWGGIYPILIKSSNSSNFESRVMIYGSDTSSIEGSKFESLIISICQTGAVLAEDVLKRDILSSLPHPWNSLTSNTVNIKRLGLGIKGFGSCGCSIYEVNLFKFDQKTYGLGKLVKDVRTGLKPLENQAEITVDPQVIRVIAPHGIYAFGPDTAEYKKNVDPIIDSSELPNLLPEDTFKSPSRDTVLAVLDSGMAVLPKIEPSTTLSQSKIDDDGSFNPTGTLRDSVPVTRNSERDELNHRLPSGGHGTPIAWLAAQGRVGRGKLFVRAEPVCDKDGHCPETKIIQGLCDALAFKDAREKDLKTKVPLVINMSLFSPTPTLVLKNVLTTIIKQSPGGVLIAAAAGNATPEARRTLLAYNELLGIQGMYPAGYASTAEVVPTNPVRARAVKIPTNLEPFSSRLQQIFGVGSLYCARSDCRGDVLQVAETSIPGSHVNFAVPGRWLQSYDPDSKLQVYSGTSFATALTSGAFVRLMMGTDLTADRIDTCLRTLSPDAFTVPPGITSTDKLIGRGSLNFRKLTCP